MNKPYIGINDEVIRYQDITEPLMLSNKDKVTSLLIKNESCNYFLYVYKNHKDGLLADKLKVAQIIDPGLFYSRSENHPRLVNTCYAFKYVAVPESCAVKNCSEEILTPFKQMSITLEKICS